MSNNNLFRLAGWCAALSIVLTLASFAMYTFSPASPVNTILATIALLAVTVVYYALSVFHKKDSAALSMAGLVLWIAAAAANFASLMDFSNNVLYAVASLLFALPLLIFGYVAYRGARMPRGLAVAALLSGVLWAIVGFISFGGNWSTGMVITLLATLTWVVWLGWLWRVFLSEKKVPA